MRALLPLLLLVSSVAAAAAAEDVELIPVKISEAREIYKGEVDDRNKAEAAKAGVDLDKLGDAYVATGYADNRAFYLFYNHARAPKCKRGYLVQRVCLTKRRVDAGGVEATEKTFMVEAFQLNWDHRTKKPDEHRKAYSRGESQMRLLLAEYEIGCGEVPGRAEGDSWPFEWNKLYKLVSPTTEDGLAYAQVKFDFSRVYRFEMEFDEAGHFQLLTPDFIP